MANRRWMAVAAWLRRFIQKQLWNSDRRAAGVGPAGAEERTASTVWSIFEKV